MSPGGGLAPLKPPNPLPPCNAQVEDIRIVCEKVHGGGCCDRKCWRRGG